MPTTLKPPNSRGGARAGAGRTAPDNPIGLKKVMLSLDPATIEVFSTLGGQFGASFGAREAARIIKKESLKCPKS